MMYEWEVAKKYKEELEKRGNSAVNLKTLINNHTKVLYSNDHISGTNQSKNIKTELEQLSSDLNELINLFNE